MAAIGTIQLVGTGGASEVELNTLAARFCVRPQDISLRGSYSVGSTFTGANAITAPTNFFAGVTLVAFRHNALGSIVYLLRRCSASLILTTAGTASAGGYGLGLVRVHQFYVQYVASGSNIPVQVSPTSNGNRLNTLMSEATADILRPPSATSTTDVSLIPPTSSGGNFTFIPALQDNVNANLISAIQGSAPLVSGSTAVSGFLWDSRWGEYPLFLEVGDGVLIKLKNTPTWSAATTIDVGFNFVWDEFEIRKYE